MNVVNNEFGVFRAVVDVQNLHTEIKNTVKQMLNARKQGVLYAEHHSCYSSCNYPQIA